MNFCSVIPRRAEMDRILLIMCSGFSCFIITEILFQFMNGRYEKSCQKKYVYFFAKIIVILSIVFVNLFNNSVLNLSAWCIAVGLSAFILYYEHVDRTLKRVLECEALALCMCVCESLGVILLQWMLQLLNIKITNAVMLHCLEVAFSKIILIFLYYMFINRLMKRKYSSPSNTQYIIYIIMLGYSLVNMVIIVEYFVQGQESYLCAVNMGCIVLADLYLLYYVKMADEKNYYENQVKALEQQANVQYGYYLQQTRKYEKTVQILHDVNKHMKAIEDLFMTEQRQKAKEYTNEIGDMLKPLIPVEYTGNPILDILLTDKQVFMKDKNILFDIKTDSVNLDFIAPIDITTIFGNLLDNAIEAAEEVEDDKYVFIKITSYRQMIVVKIENSCGKVKWKNGYPVSQKGRGIGILNVLSSIEKYDGNMKLKQEGKRFIVELFLN